MDESVNAEVVPEVVVEGAPEVVEAPMVVEETVVAEIAPEEVA